MWIFNSFLIAAVLPVVVRGQTTDSDETERKTRIPFIPSRLITLPTFASVCDVLKSAVDENRKELFYQCLPYITGINKGNDIFFPQANAMLILESPPQGDDSEEKTLISVDKMVMSTFHVLGNSDFRPDIELEIKLSWQDDRLKWDKDIWRTDHFPAELKPLLNVWGPRFSSKTNKQLNYFFDLMNYYEASLTNEGKIEATLGGQLVFSDCKMDVGSYPYDDINCCMDFAISPHDNSAKLKDDSIDPSKSIWDKNEGGVWRVREIELKRTNLSANSRRYEGAKLCVSARRNTAVLGMELSLPMGVSAVVMMCAQFAGRWQMQTFVKLFALFLQIFCFQTLIPNEALNVATRIPRIYVFYNFTIAITLFSLVQTLVFWALSRRWFQMPPPHRLISILNAPSRFLLGDSKTKAAINSSANGYRNGAVENNGDSAAPGNNSLKTLEGGRGDGFRAEWEAIFMSLHAFLSIFVILAYLIGVCIIWATY